MHHYQPAWPFCNAFFNDVLKQLLNKAVVVAAVAVAAVLLHDGLQYIVSWHYSWSNTSKLHNINHVHNTIVMSSTTRIFLAVVITMMTVSSTWLSMKVSNRLGHVLLPKRLHIVAARCLLVDGGQQPNDSYQRVTTSKLSSSACIVVGKMLPFAVYPHRTTVVPCLVANTATWQRKFWRTVLMHYMSMKFRPGLCYIQAKYRHKLVSLFETMQFM